MIEDAWKQLTERYREMLSAQMAFYEAKVMVLGQPNIVEFARCKLDPGCAQRQYDARDLRLELIAGMSDDQKMEMFPELVAIAVSGTSALMEARTIILGMPRAWVIETIEQEAEIHFNSRPEDVWNAYSCLFPLYWEISKDLYARLKIRALASEDEDIRALSGKSNR